MGNYGHLEQEGTISVTYGRSDPGISLARIVIYGTVLEDNTVRFQRFRATSQWLDMNFLLLC